MPINPQIALSVEPPKPINILDTFTRAQQLRNEQQAGQINAQTMQENDLKLESQRQASSDQDTVRSIYFETGGEPTEFIKKLKTSRLAPQTVMGIEKTINDNLDSERKRALQLTDDQRKQELDRYDQMRGMLLPIEDEPDDAKAAAMLDQVMQISKIRGLIDPKIEQVYKIAMSPGFNRQGLKILQNGLSTGKTIISEADKAYKNEIAMLRADAYAQSIDDKLLTTDFKNQSDRMRAEAYLDNVESQARRRTDMSGIERSRVLDSASKWRAEIKMAEEEEKGRNTRLESTLTNKTENIKLVQDRVDNRYGEAISKKMVSPSQVASAVSQSLKQMGYETLDDVDSSDLPAFQNLIDSYLSRQVPEFGKRSSGLFNMGSSPTVTPGKEVSPDSTTTKKTTPGKTAQVNPDSKRGAKPTNTPSANPKLDRIPQEFKDKMEVNKKYKVGPQNGPQMIVVKNADGSLTEVK
jgi:hypothetical protein